MNSFHLFRIRAIALSHWTSTILFWIAGTSFGQIFTPSRISTPIYTPSYSAPPPAVYTPQQSTYVPHTSSYSARPPAVYTSHRSTYMPRTTNYSAPQVHPTLTHHTPIRLKISPQSSLPSNNKVGIPREDLTHGRPPALRPKQNASSTVSVTPPKTTPNAGTWSPKPVGGHPVQYPGPVVVPAYGGPPALNGAKPGSQVAGSSSALSSLLTPAQIPAANTFTPGWSSAGTLFTTSLLAGVSSQSSQVAPGGQLLWTKDPNHPVVWVPNQTSAETPNNIPSNWFGGYWPWHSGWTDFNHNEPENSREAPPDAAGQEGEAQEANYIGDLPEVENDVVGPEPPVATRPAVPSTSSASPPDVSTSQPDSPEPVDPIKLSDDDDGQAEKGSATVDRARSEPPPEPTVVSDNPTLDSEELSRDSNESPDNDGFVGKALKALMAVNEFEERVENSEADTTFGKIADAAEQELLDKAKEGVVEGAEQALVEISPEAAIQHKMTEAIFNVLSNPSSLYENAKSVADTMKTFALDPFEKAATEFLNPQVDNQ
jgi:hypothetical protein